MFCYIMLACLPSSGKFTLLGSLLHKEILDLKDHSEVLNQLVRDRELASACEAVSNENICQGCK